jgi:hypothetical protein
MRRIQRLLKLTAAERRLWIEAALLLGMIRVGLRLLRLGTVRNLLRRLRRRRAQVAPERILWALASASQCVPGTGCLTRALVLQALLERYGHVAWVRIGVGREPGGSLWAHAWVEGERGLTADRPDPESCTPVLSFGTADGH